MNLNDLKLAIEDIRGNGYYELIDDEGRKIEVSFHVVKGDKLKVKVYLLEA